MKRIGAIATLIVLILSGCASHAGMKTGTYISYMDYSHYVRVIINDDDTYSFSNIRYVDNVNNYPGKYKIKGDKLILKGNFNYKVKKYRIYPDSLCPCKLLDSYPCLRYEE